jgi:hypothetical protein
MKKLFLFFFSFIFIAASSGASLNIHYCRGKVSAVSLSILPAPSCVCGKKAPKKSCCKTETKLVKMQEDASQPEYTADHSFPKILALPIIWLPITEAFFSSELTSFLREAGPPDATGVPLYLRHRVFRL